METAHPLHGRSTRGHMSLSYTDAPTQVTPSQYMRLLLTSRELEGRCEHEGAGTTLVSQSKLIAL
jgi:hypothetical protein